MVKVIQPFHSLSASGKFGDIVYDKRGIVRKYVKPNNPKTEAQGNHRQAILAARRAVRICGPETEIHLRRSRIFRRRKKREFKAGYWKSYLVGEILTNNKASYQADRQLFNHFTPPHQTEWQQAALILGLTTAQVPYASQHPVTPGEQLFLVARAISRLNIYQQHPYPQQNNAFQWASLISNQPIHPLPPPQTSITPEPLFEDILSESTQEIASIENISANNLLVEKTILESTTPADVTTKDIATKDITTKDIATEDIATENLATQNLTIEDMAIQNLTIENNIQQTPTLKNTSNKQPSKNHSLNSVAPKFITTTPPIFTKQKLTLNKPETELLSFLPFIILFLPPTHINQPHPTNNTIPNNTLPHLTPFPSNPQPLSTTYRPHTPKQKTKKTNPQQHKNNHLPRPPNKPPKTTK